MARGTTTDYLTTEMKASTIIEDALRIVGALKPGQTIQNATEVVRCQRMLNMILKRDQQEGLSLHTLTEGTLFLVAGQESYTLGTGGDNSTTSYVKTEISTAAEETDLTITVDSVTGISDGDYIGIELDDGTIQWTTVNGTPNSTTLVITITDALTDDVAVDNHVYAYTTLMEMPVRLVNNTIRREDASGIETPVRMAGRAEYLAQSSKSTEGKTNIVYYDRQYNPGTLYVWPTADDVQDVLHFSFERTIKDVDTHRDDVDIPVEAALYLTKALAAELAYSFGVPAQEVMMLKQDAALEKDNWLSFNSEQGSIYFQPGVY